jgi:hypothetical protein
MFVTESKALKIYYVVWNSVDTIKMMWVYDSYFKIQPMENCMNQGSCDSAEAASFALFSEMSLAMVWTSFVPTKTQAKAQLHAAI